MQTICHDPFKHQIQSYRSQVLLEDSVFMYKSHLSVFWCSYSYFICSLIILVFFGVLVAILFVLPLFFLNFAQQSQTIFDRERDNHRDRQTHESRP